MIRPIQKEDNLKVASIIREVMTEYGATNIGFAIHDRCVDYIFEEYDKERSIYLVITNDDQEVVGGGGIAQLKGASSDICELQKMYFLKEARGKGLGKALLIELLKYAENYGYTTCYLETTGTMKEARSLYEKTGFKPRSSPLGATGHTACESWLELSLSR